MHNLSISRLSRRTLLQAGLASSLGLTGLAAAQAPWPSKPIHFMVPYPASGVNDVVARMLGDALAKELGQPVVVENKPGAGGTIGMTELARSPADGSVFGFAAISPLTLNPYLMKVAYDPIADIQPVASVMYAPVYLIATQAFKGQTFADMLQQAKSSDRGITVATSGYGTLAHIMVEQLIRATGARLVHVPYKGGSQLITDAAGAQFDLLLANPFGPINALIAEGKLRVLATTGPQRAAAFPQLPTLGELGLETANLTSLFGFYAPAGTPAEVLQAFNARINALLASPEIQQRLRQLDNVPHPLSVQAFTEIVRREHAQNGHLIRAAQIKIQ